MNFDLPTKQPLPDIKVLVQAIEMFYYFKMGAQAAQS